MKTTVLSTENLALRADKVIYVKKRTGTGYDCLKNKINAKYTVEFLMEGAPSMIEFSFEDEELQKGQFDLIVQAMQDTGNDESAQIHE